MLHHLQATIILNAKTIVLAQILLLLTESVSLNTLIYQKKCCDAVQGMSINNTHDWLQREALIQWK
jgi:hypothetical protein